MTLPIGTKIPLYAEGNATENDVLEGKTFSTDKGNNLVGKIKKHEMTTITPSLEMQELGKGYYSGIKINPINKKVQNAMLITDYVKAVRIALAQECHFTDLNNNKVYYYSFTKRRGYIYDIKQSQVVKEIGNCLGLNRFGYIKQGNKDTSYVDESFYGDLYSYEDKLIKKVPRYSGSVSSPQYFVLNDSRWGYVLCDKNYNFVTVYCTYYEKDRRLGCKYMCESKSDTIITINSKNNNPSKLFVYTNDNGKIVVSEGTFSFDLKLENIFK